MNKIIEVKMLYKQGKSNVDYLQLISNTIDEIQSKGLEVEIHYGDESSLIVGRKVVYSAEEL